MQLTKPVVEGPLGSPPFDQLSISKAVMNLVIFKYGNYEARVTIFQGFEINSIV